VGSYPVDCNVAGKKESAAFLEQQAPGGEQKASVSLLMAVKVEGVSRCTGFHLFRSKWELCHLPCQ